MQISNYGLGELTTQEAQATNGGSITALLICAAAALLASGGCTIIIVKGDGNTVNVGDSSSQEGGTNVETAVEV